MDYLYDDRAYKQYTEMFEKYGRDGTLVYKMVCYIMFDTLADETGYILDDDLREYISDICVDAYLRDKSNMIDLSFLSYYVCQRVINGDYDVSKLNGMSAKELVESAFYIDDIELEKEENVQ